MNLKYLYALLGFFLLSFGSPAQNGFFGKVGTAAYASTSGDQLPFWFYTNKSGRISEKTTFAAYGALYFNYELRNGSFLKFGGKASYDNNWEKKIFIDELYANYKNRFLDFTLGAKTREVFYNGLSATNQNILWSNNTRPLPGVKLSTNKTIFFNKKETFGFDASLEEYYMGDNRFVKHTLLHHKYFHLIYRPSNYWEIKAGIQHFAQWGGISPIKGKQPVTFGNYLRILSARQGNEGASQADKENTLGNHLGSYELYVTRQYKKFSLQFIYNSIFEDGSGSRLSNFPDGRYGVFVKLKDEEKLITAIIYEYYYLRNQSNLSTFGPDNYFNNGPIYNSGWTYNYRVLGLPFVTYSRQKDQIINNKLVAHHLGISGHIKTYWNDYPFKLLASFSHNEGTYHSSLRSDGADENFLDLYSRMRILNKPFQLNFEIGARYDNFNPPVYGVGINLSKSFF